MTLEVNGAGARKSRSGGRSDEGYGRRVKVIFGVREATV